MSKSTLGKLLLDRANSITCRRFTRVPASIALKISGTDLGGNPFEEGAQTIDVCKQGFRTSTFHRLILNEKVRITDGSAHSALPARVVWQSHSDSPEKSAETGVEFLESLEPNGFWTLESIPEDWLNGQQDPTASQKLEYFWAREKALPVRSEEIVEPDEGLSVPASEAAPPPQIQEKAADVPAAAIPPEEIPESMPEEEKGEDAFEPITTESDGIEATADGGPENVVGLAESKVAPVRPAIAPPIDQSKDAQVKKGVPLEDLNRLARIISEQADIITKGVEIALGSVRTAAEDAISRLHLVCEESENHLKRVADEYEKHLAEIKNSESDETRKFLEVSLSGANRQLQQIQAQMEKLQSQQGSQNAAEVVSLGIHSEQEVGEALVDFQRQLGQIVNEFRFKASEELQGQLKKATANLKGISAMEQKELQDKGAVVQSRYDQYVSSRPDPLKAERDPVPRRQATIILSLGFFLMMMVALLAFAYESTQPIMQLQADPPAEFFDSSVSANLKPVEDELACEYWKCAVQVIQKTYHSGTALPEDPPAAFKIDTQDIPGLNPRVSLEASRGRYWQKLKQVWDHPQIWVQTYEWNTDWILSPLKQLGILLRG